MLPRQIACVALFTLSACVATAEPDPIPALVPMPRETTCGAAELQDLVGQSAQRLQTMRFGVTTRIIRPGMPVTMDYSPTRLNIRVDESDKIRAVTCG